MTQPNTADSKACQNLLEAIARRALDIPTLTTRNSDQLDFHDVSVWSISDALQQAYAAGFEAGQKHRT